MVRNQQNSGLLSEVVGIGESENVLNAGCDSGQFLRRIRDGFTHTDGIVRDAIGDAFQFDVHLGEGEFIVGVPDYLRR